MGTLASQQRGLAGEIPDVLQQVKTSFVAWQEERTTPSRAVRSKISDEATMIRSTLQSALRNRSRLLRPRSDS